MKTLEDTLNLLGLDQLPLNTDERDYATQFIAHRSAFFTRVCQQKSDKPQHDLALGLLTQSVQIATEEFNATKDKITDMNQLFSESVGKEHADKFKTMNALELSAIAKLWFLVQGYCGIDVSYTNEQAVELSNTLLANTDDMQFHTQRQAFMQAYYTGIEFNHKNKPKSDFLLTIKNALRRLFP
ncbi:hypothetical protein L4D09_24595 [Photobacterium makurazakiensis]|uniref:hypothetical protein n=1 Tax=Photobacterium makurazakiensis TaxID=2910234 RepID=UPI003D0D6F35